MRKISFLSSCVFLFLCCDGIEQETIINSQIINLEILDEDTKGLLTEEIGDGDKIVLLRTTIPEKTDEKFRNVSLTATDGVFVQTQNSTQTKRVSVEGIADVAFRLPLSNNEIFFTAEIGSGEDIFKAENSLKLIDAGRVITLSVLDSAKQTLNGDVRADGSVILTLAATINFSEESFNQITFKNSGGGSFLGVNATEAKVNIDENNVAFLQYRVPNTVGRIFFEALVEDNEAIFSTADRDLVRSYPDSIVVEPASVNLKLNESLSIDAFLLKNLGKVSEGTAPKFEALQLADNGDKIEVGRFTGITEAITDSDGKVTVTFFADSPNLDETRPILIIVSSRDDNNNTISEQIELEITQ